MLDTLTEDAEHDVVGVADGVHHGRDEIGAFYDRVFSLLQREGVTPLRRYYGDDFLVDEVLYTGEADGALFRPRRPPRQGELPHAPRRRVPRRPHVAGERVARCRDRTTPASGRGPSTYRQRTERLRPHPHGPRNVGRK